MQLGIKVLHPHVELVNFLLALGFGSKGSESSRQIGDIEFMGNFAIHLAHDKVRTFDAGNQAGNKVIGVVFVVDELSRLG